MSNHSMSRAAFSGVALVAGLFLMFFFYTLAQAQGDNGHPQSSDDETISRFTGALARDPKWGTAYRERGGAYFRKGDF